MYVFMYPYFRFICTESKLRYLLEVSFIQIRCIIVIIFNKWPTLKSTQVLISHTLQLLSFILRFLLFSILLLFSEVPGGHRPVFHCASD